MDKSVFLLNNSSKCNIAIAILFKLNTLTVAKIDLFEYL